MNLEEKKCNYYLKTKSGKWIRIPNNKEVARLVSWGYKVKLSSECEKKEKNVLECCNE